MAGQPVTNWAEKLTVLITLAILIVGGTQAYIYWQQEQIMQASLGQNERAAILAQGQLALASRTLDEMKTGGADTHKLAIAAENQANAAGAAARATTQVSNTTREALTSVQRAFVFFDGSSSARQITTAGKTTELELTLPWENAGVTPTKDARSWVNWKVFVGDMPLNFDFPDEGNVESRQFEISPKGLGNATLKLPIMFLEAVRRGDLRLFVWGWLAYKDIFAATPPRLSEFCDEITNVKSTPDDMSDPSAQITWQLSLCRNHNCFDDLCEDYSHRTRLIR